MKMVETVVEKPVCEECILATSVKLYACSIKVENRRREEECLVLRDLRFTELQMNGFI